MVDVAPLVLEIARLVLVVGIGIALFYLGRRHDLGDADGWGWIQVGLVFFIVESGFDVLNEFLVDRPLVAGVGLETLAEEPLLLAGFACLAYGLYRWLPLSAQLQAARDDLADANERLEARVEERTTQLEDANERLEQLIDHTPAILYTCQAEPPHEVTWLCENTRHVIDVTADELQAKADTWLAHVHPDDRDGVQANIDELAGGPNGGSIDHEYRIVVEGETRWLHETMRTIPALGSEGRRLIASAVDVTERVEAQRELEESERRLSQITENIDAVVWLGTLEEDPEDAEVLYLGPGVEELFGLSEETLRANPMAFLERVPEEHVDEVLAAMFPDGDGDGSFEVEYPVQLDDGTLKHLRTRGLPILDEDGEPYRIAGVTEDVTPRVEALQRLEHAQHRYEQLLEASARCIIELDADGVFVHATENAREVFGVPPEEIVGRTYDDPAWKARGLDGEAIAAEELPFRKVYDSRAPTKDERITVQGPDGGDRILSMYGAPILERGEVTGAVFSVDDVTEEVETRKALAESEARFRSIRDDVLEASSVGLFVLDEKFQVAWLNEATAEFFGLDREEALGRDKCQLIEERIAGTVEDPDTFRETVFSTYEDNTYAEEFTFHVLPGEGRQERWLHHSSRPIETGYYQGGRLEHYTDITGRIEAERARQESQAQLQRVIGEIDVVLFSFDEEGCYTLAEGRGLEALGLEPEDILGEHVSAFYDQPVVDLVEEALDGQKIRTQVEYEGAWLDVQLDPRYEDGEVVGADGVALNVTDVVEAEKDASRERHRYQQILKAVPRCIVHIDSDGRFTYANDRAREVLGLDPSEVSGRAYNDPDWQIRDLDGDEIPDDQLPFRRVLDTGEVVEDARHTIRWPDGRERVLSVHGAPIFDGQGDVESTVFALADITERLEREQEIELERDLRAALFEENTDPILEFGFDDENRAVIRAVNQSFRSTFGYDADEVRGRRVEDVIVPEGGEEQHEDIARRVLEGEHVGTEVERITVDGLRTFRLQLTPLELEDDRPGGYAWFTDLTKLRELEQEEAFKARMLDQVGQAVNAIDADGTITYWNQHAEEMFGYTAEEAIGENIYDLVGAHEEHREEIMDRMRRGEEWTGELAVTAKDGSTFPAVFTKEPILDEDGELDGVIGISYDVTDLRKLEREESLKARMLDQVGQAVIATDAEGNVTFWNDHAEEMYGYTTEEAMGGSILELTVPDTQEGRQQAEEILEAVEAGKEWSGEYIARRKGGSTFPALVSDSPVLDDEGELLGVIGVSRDISDIKETQRKLAALTNRLRSRNRELRDLSQAAAHGFRTPIWDTVRYLDLLEATAGDVLVGDAQEHLETARAGAHRLHDLVESLQQYLDGSTRDPGGGPTDAGAVLDDVLASLSDEIEASGAQVRVEEPAPELAVDAPSLADTFRHLLENAITFSDDEPPKIEVAFEREDEMWVVSVSDNGCGIAPEYQERVFRPFRTLHGPEEGGGAGLGLALCRGFVEIHGGAIWVTSTPGEGTTVNLTLPAAGHGIPEALEALEEDEGFDEDLELFE